MTVSPSSSITLRKAVSRDAPAVAKLGASVFSATFGHSVTSDQLQSYLDESYSVEATAKEISDCQKDMVVAETQDGELTGFALLTRGSSEPCLEQVPNKIELQRIYIDTAFQRNGVGKALMCEMERMARVQGFRYMWLGVWEENHKAQRVYEKIGYKVVGDHDFIVGDAVQTDHIMLKEL